MLSVLHLLSLTLPVAYGYLDCAILELNRLIAVQVVVIAELKLNFNRTDCPELQPELDPMK